MGDPAQRLLQLLSLLQRRMRWSGPELAEHLGVTVRTVRRDVDRLRSLGYPIDADHGPEGGYRLGNDGDLPPLLLEDDEALAIAVALGASTATAVRGIEGPALAALVKLHRLLPARLQTRVDALRASTDLLGLVDATVEPDVLITLALAIGNDERVGLDYRDRNGELTERRIEPYRLVSTHRRWYLLAFDLDRDDWRTFRVDRISSARATGHRFVPVEPPDEPVRMVQESITVAPYRHEVVVWFDAPVAVLEPRIPPSVGTVRARDGGAELRTGGEHLEPILGHIIALGLPFRVEAPEELRAMLRSLGQTLLAQH